MRTAWLNSIALAAVAIAITLVIVHNVAGDNSTQLLNVSYDPTRELFQDLNRQFVEKYFQGNRQAIDHPAVSWRLFAPGARRDRWHTRGCRHVWRYPRT
jgi:ABC-type sulfate transport system substrate-binding protein